jgi:hypothetical protein
VKRERFGKLEKSVFSVGLSVLSGSLAASCLAHPIACYNDRIGRDAQYGQHKPLQPGIATNGGGQNARATGGPGILPET